MSAVRLAPDSIETVRFLCKDSAKTLSVCMSSRLLRKTVQRYKSFLQTALFNGILHRKVIRVLFLTHNRFHLIRKGFIQIGTQPLCLYDENYTSSGMGMIRIDSLHRIP